MIQSIKLTLAGFDYWFFYNQDFDLGVLVNGKIEFPERLVLPCGSVLSKLDIIKAIKEKISLN